MPTVVLRLRRGIQRSYIRSFSVVQIEVVNVVDCHLRPSHGAPAVVLAPRVREALGRRRPHELIAPSYLSGIIARQDPRAVYVLGQPGAGKLVSSPMVKRAMRAGATRLEGDDFKASHPDHFQLLNDDPRNAGAAVRADYRAWFARAEAYVRDRRGDVLIEAAPGSAQEFLGSVLPFAGAGYPVELVVPAVRAADSRLATALQIGVSGRFTTESGHDQCFGALADVVVLAERHPAINAITPGAAPSPLGAGRHRGPRTPADALHDAAAPPRPGARTGDDERTFSCVGPLRGQSTKALSASDAAYLGPPRRHSAGSTQALLRCPRHHWVRRATPGCPAPGASTIFIVSRLTVTTRFALRVDRRLEAIDDPLDRGTGVSRPLDASR
ncbi:zeta toxin family protein [Streptomyces sp. NPDC051217]|uniref:zeta toxin family protein n=1 Tax=Streptomyces sp. NPDC051217 TaxID=3365644 RepID=UPI0037B43F4E